MLKQLLLLLHAAGLLLWSILMREEQHYILAGAIPVQLKVL
jgi:hypothetical protein